MHDLLPKILCDLHRRTSSFLIRAKTRLPAKPVFAARRETANPSRPAPKNCFFRRFCPAAAPRRGFFRPFLPRTAPAAPPDPGFFPPEHPAVPGKTPPSWLFFPASAWLFAPASPPNPPWCAPKPGFLPRFPAARPGFCPVFALVAPVLPPASRPAALPRPATASLGRRLPPDPRPAAAPAEVHFAASPWRSVWGPGGSRSLAVSPGDRRPLSRKIPRNWGPGVFSPGTQKSRPVEGGKEDL